MEGCDQSPLSKALTSQRTPKKKAAEPSREALAAFGLFRGHTRRLAPVIAVTFGSGTSSSIDAGFFSSEIRRFSRSIFRLDLFQGSDRRVGLSAQSQSTHYFVVTLYIGLLQVIEQSASLLDHH